ncbi:MAG TPA: hypothetical protein VEC57_18935 [Candidatus Limnocylindrales bacterium]|nr:hypothetical protein [Candidatus Limnocylindrales bacterium]
MNADDADLLHESRQSLWQVVASPSLWGVHFLASYGTAAVWCAKAGAGGLGGARLAIMAFTMIALLAMALIGWRGYQRHLFGGTGGTHEYDRAEDRHRFLGLATVLLTGLSALATVFTAMAALAFEDCR